uniref:EOG090X0APF n=1 Tax=Moina brachiata TaxID=675436 RepID=A0A4Y7NJ47_9CRUS|nr:EOG090X0APF [Moina brachiata]SVE93172.1 EOG090X0APF [Moina brachiata]
MEFPHLGKHCSEKTCNQLDFLPMKCDACEEIFCKDHIRYELHKCESSYKKDIQVPVCPLCNQPVPWKRGEAPDISVSDHIDRDCQSDPAKQKRKVFGNKCSLKGCKLKEVVPIICDKCKLNYCLKHRHTIDHNCKGNNPADRAREAALARASASVPTSTNTKASKSGTITSFFGPASSNSRPSQPRASQPRALSAVAVQGNLSEDEALARALQASLQDQGDALSPQQQEEADRLLALSLQQGGQSVPRQQASSGNNCRIS